MRYLELSLHNTLIKMEMDSFIVKKNTLYNIHKNKFEDVQLYDILVSEEVPSVDFKLISDKSDNIILYDSQEYVFGFSLLNDSFLDIHNLKLSIYGYKKDNYKVSLDELDLNNLIELELNDVRVDKQDFDKYSFFKQ